MKELRAIFWDLKGATFSPSCRNTRHSPAASRLLPALEAVPWIMMVLAIYSTSRMARMSRSFSRRSRTATR